MDNYKIGDEVELLEDFYTRSGAEIIFKKGTIAKVIALQLYDEIHIDVNGDNRWCSPDILKLVDKKDPALISGADVLPSGIEARKEWANGQKIQFKSRRDNSLPWEDVDENKHTLDIFRHCYWFRLKPQTIKVELEIPAPYKAKIGGRDDTSFVLNIGRHQYCYKTEEEYTKARDALEAVFDAAVRGANS